MRNNQNLATEALVDRNRSTSDPHDHEDETDYEPERDSDEEQLGHEQATFAA